MKDKTFLMIPGPTPVPETVMLEVAKHPIGHRSSEFSAILKEVYANLKYVFQTENNVFVFTSSGTGAMCAALENLLNVFHRCQFCILHIRRTISGFTTENSYYFSGNVISRLKRGCADGVCDCLMQVHIFFTTSGYCPERSFSSRGSSLMR